MRVLHEGEKCATFTMPIQFRWVCECGHILEVRDFMKPSMIVRTRKCPNCDKLMSLREGRENG